MLDPLVSIKDLYVSYYSYRGVVHALNGVFLDIKTGETVGLVGETGCGKSTIGLSIARLVPVPGKIDHGEIFFEGEDLLKKSRPEMREIRSKWMAMIFQDPTASLNPVMKVGDQIAESIIVARGKTRKEAVEEAIEILSHVGIPNPSKIVRQYPHELSGGMKQRVMIAIALSKNPRLLIADEPTSNLDVTIQAQILDLMIGLKERTGMSILFITHDMGVIAQTCDRVAVMYAGNIAEHGKLVDVFKKPQHPYTQGLLEAVVLEEEKGHLNVIPGTVPDLVDLPKGCPFSPRCSSTLGMCDKKKPELVGIEPEHFVACCLCSK